jgi:hypothetical protein
MLYFQVLFYIGYHLLLSYHYSQLIPDIYRTGLALGTSSQFVILSIYNFSSYILGILFFCPFTNNPYCADVSSSFWNVPNRDCLVLVVSRMLSAYAVHCFRHVVIFPLISIYFSIVSINLKPKSAIENG